MVFVRGLRRPLQPLSPLSLRTSLKPETSIILHAGCATPTYLAPQTGWTPRFFPGVAYTAWGLYSCILPSNRNAVVISVPGKTLQPHAVPGTVSGASPDRWVCTSNSSTRTSNGPMDTTPVSFLVGQPRTRNRISCDFLIGPRRHRSYLHCRAGRSVRELNLYSSARKRHALSRQTINWEIFALRVCRQL